MKNNPLIIGIARGDVVKTPGELITYALGSCVGVCLYDRRKHIAGMAHILLPSYWDSADQTNPYKFADTGCERLVQTMEQKGADRQFITAKIAGGAKMFRTDGKTEGIGERNVKAVKRALDDLGIRLISEDTGKDYGRTIILNALSGSLTVKSVRYGVKVI